MYEDWYSYFSQSRKEDWHDVLWWGKRLATTALIGGALASGTILGFKTVVVKEVEHDAGRGVEIATSVGVGLAVDLDLVVSGGYMAIQVRKWKQLHQTADYDGWYDDGVKADRPHLNAAFNEIVRTIDPQYDRAMQDSDVE